MTASGVSAVSIWGGVWGALVGGMTIEGSVGSDWTEDDGDEEMSHLVGGVDLVPDPDPDACLARVVDNSRSAPVLMSRAKPSTTACVISGDRSERKSCVSENA